MSGPQSPPGPCNSWVWGNSHGVQRALAPCSPSSACGTTAHLCRWVTGLRSGAAGDDNFSQLVFGDPVAVELQLPLGKKFKSCIKNWVKKPLIQLRLGGAVAGDTVLVTPSWCHVVVAKADSGA